MHRLCGWLLCARSLCHNTIRHIQADCGLFPRPFPPLFLFAVETGVHKPTLPATGLGLTLENLQLALASAEARLESSLSDAAVASATETLRAAFAAAALAAVSSTAAAPPAAGAGEGEAGATGVQLAPPPLALLRAHRHAATAHRTRHAAFAQPQSQPQHRPHAAVENLAAARLLLEAGEAAAWDAAHRTMAAVAEATAAASRHLESEQQLERRFLGAQTVAKRTRGAGAAAGEAAGTAAAGERAAAKARFAAAMCVARWLQIRTEIAQEAAAREAACVTALAAERRRAAAAQDWIQRELAAAPVQVQHGAF